MDFAEYLRPLRARWWLIAIIGIVAAVASYRYYAGKPVVYSASTSLYMVGSSNALTGQANSGPTDPTFIPNQAILIKTEAVAAVAAKDLGFRGYPGDLLGSVGAAPVTGTDFMTITGVAPDSLDAVRIANAFATAYISTSEQTDNGVLEQDLKTQQARLAALPNDTAHQDERAEVEGLISQLQLQESLPTVPAKQVQPALVGVPTQSDPTSHAIFALFVGLLIGAGLAFLLDTLDRRLKRVGDIEELYGEPVIAKVPWVAPKVCNASPQAGLQPPLAEAFRGLRTALQLRAVEHSRGNGNGNGAANGHVSSQLRTILIVSAIPDEGKSTVARNLALAYLEAGNRVAVVDCDMRQPDLTKSFGVEPTPGLPEVLTGDATVSDCLQTVEVANQDLETMIRARRGTRAESMYLVTAGGAPAADFAFRRGAEPSAERPPEPALAVLPSSPPPWNPAAVFEAGGMEDVLGTLRSEFDVIIMDSSPLATVSDAAPLLSLADAVLVVSRIRKSQISAVQELRTVLGRVPHTDVVGVVANDVRDRNGTFVYSRAYGNYS